MDEQKSSSRKSYLVPGLFLAAVVLVFVALFVTLSFRNSKIPSVAKGATVAEVNDYAYQLLELDSEDETGRGYLEALAYYSSQISLAEDTEQQFNLRLDLASLLGRTGDPFSGIDVLNNIDSSELPPDALYYLYGTYIYLYQVQGDTASAEQYFRRLADEGIYDYIARLDSGEESADEDKDEDDDDDDEGEEDILFEEEAI